MENNINFFADFLTDDWELKGTDPEEFKSIIREVDERTSYKKLSFRELTVCSVDRSDEGDIKVLAVSPERMYGYGQLNYLNQPGMFGELDEKVETELIMSGFGIKSENGNFIVSRNAFNSLGQRLGNIIGADEKSWARDNSIAYLCKVAESDAFIASIKEDKGIRKIFAALTGQYAQIPLDILNKMSDDLAHVSKLGTPACEGWNVSHDLVSINYSFPEYAEEISGLYKLPEDMMPCVRLMTSDTGECAVRAAAYWKTSAGDIIWQKEPYARDHKGMLDDLDVLKEVRRKVYDRLEILPKTLRDLSYIGVTPAGLDLTTEDGRNDNFEAVADLYEAVLDKTNVAKVIGKKRMDSLKEAIRASYINGSETYTVYAVVMDILALPRTMKSWWSGTEMSEESLERFQTEVSKVPYLDFYKLLKIRKPKKKGGNVYLTPDFEPEQLSLQF